MLQLERKTTTKECPIIIRELVFLFSFTAMTNPSPFPPWYQMSFIRVQSNATRK